MDMIGNESPPQTKSFRLGDDITQTLNEIIPVLIIWEYTSALDSANHDMIQGTGSIHACDTWHIFFISQKTLL
jgi:hypothetical protein